MYDGAKRSQPSISSRTDGGETAQERIDQLIADHGSRRRKPIPRWVSPVMRVLPHVLITVTVVNGLIGVIAILTPYLASWFGSAAADPIYSAYSLICPQRPSHTFFIDGHPMAFEQRDVAMHIGFGITGLLYLVIARLRQPLPTWGLVLGVAPLLIDVLISSVGILPSTWFSRLWTGALASFVIVWWSYPRFERYYRRVQDHVARLRGGEPTATRTNEVIQRAR